MKLTSHLLTLIAFVLSFLGYPQNLCINYSLHGVCGNALYSLCLLGLVLVHILTGISALLNYSWCIHKQVFVQAQYIAEELQPMLVPLRSVVCAPKRYRLCILNLYPKFLLYIHCLQLVVLMHAQGIILALGNYTFGVWSNQFRNSPSTHKEFINNSKCLQVLEVLPAKHGCGMLTNSNSSYLNGECLNINIV